GQVAPRLSIVYDSGAAGGVAGLGGHVAGLSVIHRCPATAAQDGRFDGVSRDGADRFCIDDRRLVRVAGDGGAEYRTEVETFQKIVAVGSVPYPDGGSGPRSFVVHPGDGSRLEYGAEPSSRDLDARGVVVAWRVSRLEDVDGNTMAYRYAGHVGTGPDGERTVERLPVEIAYGGNPGQGVSLSLAVRFHFEERPDRRYGYAGGVAFAVTRRLRSVETRVGAQTVRRYHVVYVEDGLAGRSRIAS
ncbi:MAG: hypothetical protein GWN07_34000, partial [Actinobacteria bacterium]|nr:hypothetical protein [Actinomycetota bacterium]NIS36162.1 hypothetical protein [Actinomycetota bacterium]NIU70734.1 hypothetical protein [Actinomycetota bacterium]NIW32639.1 hypothetical protein [Actinomycetota bacterium]NIX24550.1 hypothetical protein [Actinomycetota bacterium]